MKPAKACCTGITSMVLTLKCAGIVATQWMVSAMSSAVMGAIRS